MGFDAFNVGPELEFFYFRDARPEDGDPRGARRGRLLRPDHARRRRPASAARRCSALEQMGIHVEYTHHEVGPSQHEVDMRYKDALAMADDCMTYRMTVKEYAMKNGWHATFMPKPLNGENGSGMHVHQSLSRDGTNAFYDPDDQYFLSQTAKAVHRRPAQARARDLVACSRSGSTPTSGSSPATRPPSTWPGRGATARR